MNKHKLLRFGQAYLNNKEGDFAVALIKGSKKAGYKFAVSHAYASRLMYFGHIYTLSRIVPNDGYWKEISDKMFEVMSVLHMDGYAVKTPTDGVFR